MVIDPEVVRQRVLARLHGSDPDWDEDDLPPLPGERESGYRAEGERHRSPSDVGTAGGATPRGSASARRGAQRVAFGRRIPEPGRTGRENRPPRTSQPRASPSAESSRRVRSNGDGGERRDRTPSRAPGDVLLPARPVPLAAQTRTRRAAFPGVPQRQLARAAPGDQRRRRRRTKHKRIIQRTTTTVHKLAHRSVQPPARGIRRATRTRSAQKQRHGAATRAGHTPHMARELRGRRR